MQLFVLRISFRDRLMTRLGPVLADSGRPASLSDKESLSEYTGVLGASRREHSGSYKFRTAHWYP
jgi:hypothetical protein